MRDLTRLDAHVHVETEDATPGAVLALARRRGLTVGLVDHVFADRDRITSDAVKARCREEFPDVPFLHGCEADAYAPGKVAVRDARSRSRQTRIALQRWAGPERPGTGCSGWGLPATESSSPASLTLLAFRQL